ncbi:hypothetical protein Pan54_12230 [Rubinisphaera italica]|uniref:Uncharacterized protein n=1 Tax=Rubinisphaera italica TaxID=2527969 RepID=A0A5C5XD12_9PLAN|nr:hypothetical protein Pan54_12230 [Rubinisphaera italica]
MSKQTCLRHQLEKALLDSSNLIQNRNVERFCVLKQNQWSAVLQWRPLDDNVKVFNLILKMKLNQLELPDVVALMNSLKNSFVDLSKIT